MMVLMPDNKDSFVSIAGQETRVTLQQDIVAR
jgi:hypothetical protein